MVVLPKDLSDVLARLQGATHISLDCETTGLRPWQGDRLFSIIIGTASGAYYFDFKETLPRATIPLVGRLLEDHLKVVFMHNAKFDMAMLYQDGIRQFNAQIIDTMVLSRIFRNDLMSYSLDALARVVGEEKNNALEKWAIENGCWEWEQKPGQDKRSKRILFHKVPLEVIQPYGEKDAEITYKLGMATLAELRSIDESRLPEQPSVLQVIASEMATTKELFEMEREGVLLDRDYTDEARTYETLRFRGCEEEFEATTGIEFVDSAKCLSGVFEKFAPDDLARFRKTAKGNWSFKDDVIATFTSPLAALVREHRDAYKRAGTYFGNYLHLVGSDGRIHTNFRQSGTATGRLSASDPNLQNVTKGKDKESRFPVRRCFTKPEDFYWVSFDYDQMEYRLMLDYAGEKSVIAQVLDGLDVHQATANMMGVDRQSAKTLNFMLLYGGGVAKLAAALGIKLADAKELKNLYFARLPRVSQLIQEIIRKAETRKMVYNWYGRMYRFPDKRFAYKAPNYLIQGGCADVVKLAMTRAGNRGLLSAENARSRLVLQVHDELDYYVHKNELDLLPKIKGIMESVYPYKHLPLTAGISLSESSWADVEDYDAWMQSTSKPSSSLLQSGA